MASEKITAIIDSVKELSVLELKELIDAYCEEFGVSAVAAAAPAYADKHPLSFFDAVPVNMQLIASVFQIIGYAYGFSWQLARLAYRYKSDSQLIGDRTAEDKAAGFRTDNDVGFHGSGKVNHLITGLLKRLPIRHQRCYITKQNPFLRKIRNTGNII